MMPSRGLSPLAGSARTFSRSPRVAARFLSTASAKPHPRANLSRHHPLRLQVVQQRNISWSPSSWIPSGSSQSPASPLQPPPETAAASAASPTSNIASSQTAFTSPTSSQTATTTSAPASSPSVASAQQTTSGAAPISPEPVDAVQDGLSLDLDSLQNVGDSYLADIPEQIGYLKALGLDYGWGPTSVLEWFLEHVHIWSGLPWGGSIVLSAFIFRAALFPLFLKSSDVQARLTALKPVTSPLTKRMQEQFQNSDSMGVQASQQELKAIYKRAGISYTDMFTPIIIQGCMAFCALRLMRAMANLPVPGFTNGGALWFTDLTVSDPTLVLPLVMAGSMHLIFRYGGEGANIAMQDNPGMKNLFLYVMPVGIFISMAWFPAAVNLWLATTGAFGILQAKLLQNQSVRERLNLAPIVKPAAAAPAKATPGRTIDVSGSSRSFSDSSRVRYQAPNIRHQGSESEQAASEPEKPKSPGFVQSPKAWSIERANEIGTGFSDFMARARTMRDKYLGQSNKSKTRSRQYIERAAAYEKRTQDRKQRRY